VLHDRTRDADHVGFLESVSADHVTGYLARQDHHRNGIHERRGDAGNGIGCAWTGSDQHHAGLAGRARVAISHMSGRLLVTHQNMLDIVLAEDRIVDVQ
jgi:hypothetical protein